MNQNSAALDLSVLPAEVDLLLQTVGLALGRREVLNPKADIDWDGLLKAAEWHRLIWALYEAQSHLPQMPVHIQEALAVAHREVATHNLRLMGALINVTKILNQKGIPFLTLKGMPLAQVAFGEIGRRRSRDLDILVRPEDVVRTRDVLCETLGFVPGMDLDDAGMKLLLRTEKELKLTADGLLLELHWGYAHMAGLFPGEPPGDDPDTETLGGLPLPVMPPDDLFIYLAYHGASHFWFRFFWLVDLLFLHQRRPLDWDALMARARDLGQERATAFSVGLAWGLVGDDLPEQVQQVWQQNPEMADYAREWLALFAAMPARGDAYHVGAPLARVYKWFLRMFPHMRTRIFAKVLFQPSIHDMLALPLPRLLHPLYYLTRPFMLVGRLLWQR